jgi:hypothetical protein
MFSSSRDSNPVRMVRNSAMNGCLITQIRGTLEMPTLSTTTSILTFFMSLFESLRYIFYLCNVITTKNQWYI